MVKDSSLKKGDNYKEVLRMLEEKKQEAKVLRISIAKLRKRLEKSAVEGDREELKEIELLLNNL